MNHPHIPGVTTARKTTRSKKTQANHMVKSKFHRIPKESNKAPSSHLLERLRKDVVPLNRDPSAWDALLQRTKKCPVVLLGEATHGTHEFYKLRAEITRRLIEEQGFNAVAIEADWPDAYQVNRYVRAMDGANSVLESLAGFRRFPHWMWRNRDMVEFLDWLRKHNTSKSRSDRPAGFYGLDLYSLHDSIDAVLNYLAKVDPAAARRMVRWYGCFETFGGNPRTYGYQTGMGLAPSCEKEVVRALQDLRIRKEFYMLRNGGASAEEYFCAEQNAVVVRDAEKYYRTMLRADVSSWNIRDQHMMDTLLSLMRHLNQMEGRAKVVVWAHNSHLGNAEATQMHERGEFNLGQLVRNHFGDQSYLVGFTTYEGTVTASSDWDGPAERKRIRPALETSYECLFHEVGVPRFWLEFSKDKQMRDLMRFPRLERAIGVVYQPESERRSHYQFARLADQFDAVVHVDRTRAVEPLEKTVYWEHGEVDETYPTGL
ncbi:MAG: hypothetical protein RL549_135 [Verrucomicrobiota bacterium]|jgi:erythromycin esterase-like protein